MADMRDLEVVLDDIRREIQALRGSGTDLGLFVITILLALILWRVW